MGQLALQEMILQVKTHICARTAKINVVQESVLKTRQSKLNEIEFGLSLTTALTVGILSLESNSKEGCVLFTIRYSPATALFLLAISSGFRL